MLKLLKVVNHRWKLKVQRPIYTWIVSKRAKSVGKDLRVNFKSSVTDKTVLGDNVNFNGMRVIGLGSLKIGNNFHSGGECLIITSNHNFKGSKIPYDSTHIIKNVVIEDNVWLGERVIVLGGVTIGEGAIIQAGSVVVSNIPPCAIAGGHPAKVFSERDLNHYNRLKSQSEFS